MGESSDGYAEFSQFVGGVQRGRSPFCRVFEGVPQNYDHEGGWAGKER